MYPQSSMCLHTECATMPLISPFLMERKLVAIINVYGKNMYLLFINNIFC